MANNPEKAPSVASIATATAIISFLMGYFFAQARSLGLVGKTQLHQEIESDSDSDSQSGDAAAELKNFSGDEECKLVLVTRTDLGMVSIIPIAARAVDSVGDISHYQAADSLRACSL